MIVGLLHPGEMGAAIGRAMQGDVVWASEGRSEATRERASAFRDVRTLQAVVQEADVIVSVCPPHAALEVADSCRGFEGVYVDANAISPAHADAIGAVHPRFVDCGIVGGPDAPVLYLSGDGAAEIAQLFALETRVVGNASALKMVYAAWTKGTAAMLLAIRETAAHFGVEEAWREAAPELGERLARADASAAKKGWRWAGEMEEIAQTFASAGQPGGFHRAAAEVFRR